MCCISIASNLPHLRSSWKKNIYKAKACVCARACMCLSKRTFSKKKKTYVHVLADLSSYFGLHTASKVLRADRKQRRTSMIETPADGPTLTCLCEVGRVTAALHGSVSQHRLRIKLSITFMNGKENVNETDESRAVHLRLSRRLARDNSRDNTDS